MRAFLKPGYSIVTVAVALLGGLASRLAGRGPLANRFPRSTRASTSRRVPSGSPRRDCRSSISRHSTRVDSKLDCCEPPKIVSFPIGRGCRFPSCCMPCICGDRTSVSIATGRTRACGVLDVVLGLKADPIDGRVKSPFFDGPDGLIRVSLSNLNPSQSGEAHPDVTLAILGELGVPLSQPIGGPALKSPATLGTVFSSILLRYDDQLAEQEWTAMAIARYLPPATSWRNRWGERFTLDDLAQKLLRKKRGTGACGGTHRLEALCVFLLVDRQQAILAEPTRSAIVAELRETSQRLEHVQLASGAWTLNWAKDDPPIASAWLPDEQNGALLHATGHHLEWIALAPPELRPRRNASAKPSPGVFLNCQHWSQRRGVLRGTRPWCVPPLTR